MAPGRGWRGVSVLSLAQVRSEDPIDSISVIEDSDGDLLCRGGIVKLSHCRENLFVGLCLVGEDPFKRADLIHVLSPIQVIVIQSDWLLFQYGQNMSDRS